MLPSHNGGGASAPPHHPSRDPSRDPSRGAEAGLVVSDDPLGGGSGRADRTRQADQADQDNPTAAAPHAQTFHAQNRGAGTAGSVRWVRFSASGSVTHSGEVSGDDALPGKAKGAAGTIAIVPGADVAVHRVPAMKGSEAQVRNAALYAVEDDIAMDLDAVHLALGPRGDGPTRLAGVVAHDTMAGWMAQLARLGIDQPDCVIPDCLALAPSTAAGVVIDTGGAVIINAGDVALTIEPDLVSAVAPSVLAEANIDTLRLMSDRVDALGLGGWVATAGTGESTSGVDGAGDGADAGFGAPGVGVEPAPDPDQLASLFRDGVAAGPRVNLVQGAFAKRGDVVDEFRAWTRAGVLVVVLGVLAIVGTLVQTMAYERAEREARQDSARIVAALFPGEPPARNPAARVRTEMSESAGGDSDGVFLTLSAVLLEALQANPTVELDGLRFAVEDGALVASIVFGGFNELTALTSSLETAGVTVNDRGSRSIGGRQSGELEIRIP